MSPAAVPVGADEPLFECVPNFSEGRDEAVLAALVDAIAAVHGARVLDHSMDADHNRAVVTFVGTAAVVEEAALSAVDEAARRIDLRRHAGVHPRIGATDVLPIVPLVHADEPRAVALAHALGARIGYQLHIPVYYYGAAARTPARRALPDIRRGGFEGLSVALPRDPTRRPDAGPVDALHPSAGATAVGVRPFLIAFNVDLDTDDVAVARRIAAVVREAGGGLPSVRALGLYLAGRGTAQVSMNLVDHERTGLVAAFEAVEAEARAQGVGVRASELIGLAPAAALDAAVAARVRLLDFRPERHVLEARVAAASMHTGASRTAPGDTPAR